MINFSQLMMRVCFISSIVYVYLLTIRVLYLIIGWFPFCLAFLKISVNSFLCCNIFLGSNFSISIFMFLNILFFQEIISLVGLIINSIFTGLVLWFSLFINLITTCFVSLFTLIPRDSIFCMDFSVNVYFSHCLLHSYRVLLYFSSLLFQEIDKLIIFPVAISYFLISNFHPAFFPYHPVCPIFNSLSLTLQVFYLSLRINYFFNI